MLRSILLVSAFVVVSLPAADGPFRPHIVDKLELTEPSTKTKVGLAKIKAKVTAGKDSKVKIVFDVEYQFDDPDVELEWSVVDDGASVQVVIPDSKGIIKVAAVAVIDGEPTKFAKTFIEVDYKPRDRKPLPPVIPKLEGPRELPKEKAQTGRITEVYFIVDVLDGDPDVNALAGSVALRNKLRAKGVTPRLFDRKSDNVDRERFTGGDKTLAKTVNSTGAPCVIYANEKGIVRAAKLTKDTRQEDIVKALDD